MSSNRAYLESGVELLSAHGIHQYKVVPGGKHPKIVFALNGVTRKFPFPRSPSDRRGLANWLSDLKRKLKAEAAND